MGKKGTKKNENDIRIKFLGVDDEVTGSANLVEVDGLKILLDLGLFQSQTHKPESIYRTNYKKMELIPFDELDYIILTSSHADHCCGLGIIGRQDINFNGAVICTELSQELINLNVRDSAFLMSKECEAYNKKHKENPLKPLYSREEAIEATSYLRGYGYHQEIKLNDNVSMEFMPNGHLCGDGSIYITYKKGEYEKKRLLYTGDFNYGKEKAFTKKWDTEDLKVDIILTESTYAGEIQPKGNPIDELEEAIITECVQGNQVLIIPSFAIHRATEIAYMLKTVYDRNSHIRKANIPIYFAGVMMAQAHRIMGKPQYKEFYDEQWQHLDNVFSWDKIRMIERFQDVEEKLTDNKCKIIVCSSGMLNGGYGNYIASMMMGREKTSFLFTGYQGEGTIGRKILDGNQKTISVNGVPRLLKARVLGKIEGLSGHADGQNIVKFIKQFNQKTIKKIVIVHGVNERKHILKQQLDEIYHNEVEVKVPKVGEVVKV